MNLLHELLWFHIGVCEYLNPNNLGDVFVYHLLGDQLDAGEDSCSASIN